MTLPDDFTMLCLQAIEDGVDAGGCGWSEGPGDEIVLYVPEELYSGHNAVLFPLAIQTALTDRGWIVLIDEDGIGITEQGRYALKVWRKRNGFDQPAKRPPVRPMRRDKPVRQHR